ncbi:MAG: hypothetical protein HKP27_11220 [Myxococcales bacterium]|nr:hypothetical protein [Myxococcales bacterium]
MNPLTICLIAFCAAAVAGWLRGVATPCAEFLPEGAGSTPTEFPTRQPEARSRAA